MDCLQDTGPSRERRELDACLCAFGVHWKSVEGGGARICFLAGVPRGGVYRERKTGYWYIYPRFGASERVGPFALMRAAQGAAMRDYFAGAPRGMAGGGEARAGPLGARA